jgi:ABC-type cobalamin transport system permease subunit
MRMNKKIFNIIIEIAYILMGIFCVVIGLTRKSELSSQFVWVFYALGIICFAMFAVRFFTRKNQEKRRK